MLKENRSSSWATNSSTSRRRCVVFGLFAGRKMVHAVTAIEAMEVYPTIRFTPWQKINETAKEDAEILGYRSERSWDNVGSNSIERLSYETIGLRSPKRASAIRRLMEEAEESWDCYVNHYDDYSWEELEKYELVETFTTLGYDEYSWMDDKAPRPDVENENWVDLRPEERLAAEYICYFQELWDEIPLPDWEEHQEIRVEATSDGNTQTIIAAASVIGLAFILGTTLLFRFRRGKARELRTGNPRSSSSSRPTQGSAGVLQDDKITTLEVPLSAFRAATGRQSSLSVDEDDGISTLECPTAFGDTSYGDDNTESVVVGVNLYSKTAIEADGQDGRVQSFETDSMSPDSSLEVSVNDSESFDLQFSDDPHDIGKKVKRFRIEAPPGKLGMVIDTALDGEPTVLAMKPDSILGNHVHIGDKLVSVDGQDVTGLDADQVATLISSKSDQPHLFIFIRSKGPSEV